MLHNMLHMCAKYYSFCSKTLASQQLTMKPLSIYTVAAILEMFAVCQLGQITRYVDDFLCTYFS
jgi:hypothetical protein